MSYNFGHEVTVIRNADLRQRFAFDYFHDSLITSISFLEQNSLGLTFACEREWRNAKSGMALGADDRFRHEVVFGTCGHIEIEREFPQDVAEFINARFKDSIALAQIKKATRRRHYHLRMELVDGFIDVIFGQFSMISGTTTKASNAKSRIQKYTPFCLRIPGATDTRLVRLANSDDNRAEDAMLTLLDRGDRRALAAARRQISCEDMGAWATAVFIVGQLGSQRDLRLLMANCTHTNHSALARRHRDDAVERILNRLND